MPAYCTIFNSHKNPVSNTVYDWAQVINMVENPRVFDAELSTVLHDKINPSDPDEYISNKFFNSCVASNNCSRKTKDEVTKHNQMHYLRVDSDDNEYTIEELKNALLNIGLNTFVIHTSWSHQPNFIKLKALIPLSTPLDCDTWQNLQERVTEALNTDDCMDSRNQISYTPATYPGNEYDYLVVQNGQHDFTKLPQLRPIPQMEKREVASYDGDSLIEEYNSRFNWDYELQSNGYIKKGNKWLSPSASSKLAGGKVFTGDDGKEYFYTFHTSDPINAVGAVDGFGFTCVIEGKTAKEMTLALSNGELKEWNKEKQKRFAEGKKAEAVATDEDFSTFADIFAKNKVPAPIEQAHALFGNISAPASGSFSETPQVQKILHTEQFAPKSDEVKSQQDETSPEWLFETPVDTSINLYNAPGIVGECINYINEQARKPRKTLAVSAALSAIGLIGGLTHEDIEYGATSNLFCFNIAGSGTGKENIIQSTNDIIQESGITQSFYGKIKSEQEIYRNLINSQAAYYNIDEIGEVLGKITSSKETYMTGIIGTLMSLYSKASGKITLGGDEIKDIKTTVEKRIDALCKRIENNEDKTGTAQEELDKLNEFNNHLNSSVLVNPFLSIMGCTTPDLFVKIATRANVLSGFIGRALMFTEHDDAPRSNLNFKPKKTFPASLSHELKKIFNTGNQKLIPAGRVQNYGEKVAIPTTPEAKRWLQSLQWNIETDAIEHGKTTGFHGIINRQFELILKVSLVLAIGDGKKRTLEHVKWAQYLVSRDVETKIDMVNGNEEEENQSASEKAEEVSKKIISALEKQGEMTQKRLVNRIRGLDSDYCVKALKALISANIVEPVEGKKGQQLKYKLIN